jgi:hypothetical protein
MLTGFMKQLCDLQIGKSSKFQRSIGAADHEQEAKQRSEISRRLDKFDRISDLTERQRGEAV